MAAGSTGSTTRRRHNPHTEPAPDRVTGRRRYGSTNSSGRPMSDAEYRAALAETGGTTDEDLAAGSTPSAVDEHIRRLSSRPDPIRGTTTGGRPARGASRAQLRAQGLPTPGGLTGAPGTEDVAGVMLGLLVTTLIVNYLQGGEKQVRQWFAAKFLNRSGPVSAFKDPKAGVGGGGPKDNAGGGGGGSSW